MRDNKGFACHRHRNLVSFEIHHIWPSGYHGPDIATNRIKICPNAHSDIHFLLELMLKGRAYDEREFGVQVRRYARLGYNAVTAYADSLALQKENNNV